MITTAPAMTSPGPLIGEAVSSMDSSLPPAWDSIMARRPMLTRRRSVRQRWIGSPRSRRSVSSMSLTMSGRRLPRAVSRLAPVSFSAALFM